MIDRILIAVLAFLLGLASGRAFATPDQGPTPQTIVPQDTADVPATIPRPKIKSIYDLLEMEPDNSGCAMIVRDEKTGQFKIVQCK